jgi:hypothetical protein
MSSPITLTVFPVIKKLLFNINIGLNASSHLVPSTKNSLSIVGVGVGLVVNVGVILGVTLFVGVIVGVGLGVDVKVIVGVNVGVIEGVGVGVGPSQGPCSTTTNGPSITYSP